MVYCRAMHTALTAELDLIEARVAAAGQSMNEFLRIARVSRSTWWRWRAGEMTPGMRAWNRVREAANRLPWADLGISSQKAASR